VIGADRSPDRRKNARRTAAGWSRSRPLRRCAARALARTRHQPTSHDRRGNDPPPSIRHFCSLQCVVTVVSMARQPPFRSRQHVGRADRALARLASAGPIEVNRLPPRKFALLLRTSYAAVTVRCPTRARGSTGRGDVIDYGRRPRGQIPAACGTTSPGQVSRRTFNEPCLRVQRQHATCRDPSGLARPKPNQLVRKRILHTGHICPAMSCPRSCADGSSRSPVHPVIWRASCATRPWHSASSMSIARLPAGTGPVRRRPRRCRDHGRTQRCPCSPA
jgi:hypothetical protein